MPLSKRAGSFITALILAAATLLAYGDALRLPFFFDDMTHYTWLRGQSLLSIFLSAAGRPYYRPLQFFLWKLYETIFNADSVWFYHALSLIAHALNALLVTVLVRRLSRRPDRWWPAMLAGLIFVWFPFSYQVVTLPASFTHPMAALFVLLTVLTYDRFRETAQRRWLVSAGLLAVMAHASNEGTLMLFGLIALTEWLPPRPRRDWRWVPVFAIIAVAYYGWYQSRPHDLGGAFGLRQLETIVQNAIYALQGLTYPAQPLGRILMDGGLSDQAAVLGVAAPVMIGLAVVLARAGRGKSFVFGAGWYVLSMVAPVLLLSHDYLINAPRTLYVASIGAAWLWALAMDSAAGVLKPIGWRRGLAVALAVLILAPSLIFIRQRMDLHNLNAAPLNEALAAAQAQPADQLLFVNLPAWISTPQLWYPIGHEGALFMPSYSTMAEFVATNLNRPARDVAVEFNNLSTPQPYYYGVYGPALGWDDLERQVRAADRVYFTTYAPDRIELLEAGRLIRSTGEAAVAVFGDMAVLRQTDWSICARRLQVRLTWQAVPEGDWHVFVQLLNPDGSLAAQHDSPPLMGLMPFWQFQPGDVVEDVHPIDLATLPADRTYALVTGLYDPATGERLPVRANGAEPADRAVRVAAVPIGADANCR